MKTVFKFRPSGVGPIDIKGKDPQVVGDELNRLRDMESLGLTAQGVVDAARPESSPLHSIFEWDDTLAARRFRKYQARALIKSIEVVRVDNENISRPVPGFVNVVKREQGNAPRRVYECTTTAMKSPDMRAQVISKALKELVSWKDRYESYKEFDLVFTAITSTKQKITA